MGEKPSNVKTSVSSPMTKDLLMKYTLVALGVLVAPAIVAFGVPALIMSLIGVVIAVACDYAVSFVSRKRIVFDLYSSAVCGLIVALSFSSGIPYSTASNLLMDPNMQYVVVALISAVAVVVFKKIQGFLGRKYVNPAATAKLLALAPIYAVSLMPQDHLVFNIATADGLKNAVSQMCYTWHEPIAGTSFNALFADPLLNLTILKSHGWLGGASSIAVIIVGIAFILSTKGYVKWRIPLAYLTTVGVISAGYGFFNSEDIVLRVAYHLFVGSVIFLAFFMATDPATTPITGLGQIVFAIGLGILTIIFQMYVLFLGGSILALVIMNLTTPLLDRVGLPKPLETRISRRVPKARKFKNAPVTDCIRCGRCLQLCCMSLSPIVIKEAVDKGDWERAKLLRADFCEECGHCNYVCPARIDLKSAVLTVKKKILAA